jgi:NAD(P)-dependent dehydrogenase (short-subunit alcohol dehydrogenase family)
MRILIIGANGAIGKIITAELSKKHEIITAGRNSGDIRVDISSADSIKNMFQQVKQLDACICVAGDSETCDLLILKEDHLKIGIKSKLLGQTNLVLIGQNYLNDNGSFTLTSGKMGDKPIKGATGKAFVNGAVNSFVLAASLDLQRGLRLNAVSPAKIGSVSNEEISDAYRKCVENDVNGEVFRIY